MKPCVYLLRTCSTFFVAYNKRGGIFFSFFTRGAKRNTSSRKSLIMFMYGMREVAFHDARRARTCAFRFDGITTRGVYTKFFFLMRGLRSATRAMSLGICNVKGMKVFVFLRSAGTAHTVVHFAEINRGRVYTRHGNVRVCTAPKSVCTRLSCPPLQAHQLKHRALNCAMMCRKYSMILVLMRERGRNHFLQIKLPCPHKNKANV